MRLADNYKQDKKFYHLNKRRWYKQVNLQYLVYKSFRDHGFSNEDLQGNYYTSNEYKYIFLGFKPWR